jgi:DNA-binding protein H-NS
MARAKDKDSFLEALKEYDATELQEIIDAAHGLRRSKIDEARTSLVEEMRTKAKALGLSLEDLVGGKSKAAAPSGGRATVAAKYKFPSGKTWSGRGKLPKEAAELKHQHGSLEGYKIAS